MTLDEDVSQVMNKGLIILPIKLMHNNYLYIHTYIHTIFEDVTNASFSRFIFSLPLIFVDFVSVQVAHVGYCKLI